jgi:hypothetical protein
MNAFHIKNVLPMANTNPRTRNRRRFHVPIAKRNDVEERCWMLDHHTMQLVDGCISYIKNVLPMANTHAREPSCIMHHAHL